MLTFDSGLLSSLKFGNTTPFWVLKLYYNDDTTATNFIGVSDTHRVDSADTYHGIVSSWGNYQQSLSFFSFSTSTGNLSIKLINAEHSIQGGRFSDLLATNNFANRKWQLFQNTNGLSTFDTAARMIGTGVISGDIKYDNEFVSLTLLDMSSRYYHTIPRSTVNSTDHTNAPDKNYTKPIPIAYGDFHEKDSIGTIPTTNFDRFIYFYKGAFPAIVVDEWNATNARIEAACDIMSMHTLDADNVYGHFKNSYAHCDTSTITANSGTVTATGDDFRVYVPLLSHATYAAGGGSAWSNYAHTINGNFDGNYVTLAADDEEKSIGWRIPKIEKLGTLTSVHLLMSFSNGTGNANQGFYVSPADNGSSLQVIVASGNALSGVDGEHIETITGLYGGTDSAEWDLEDDVFLVLDDDGGSGCSTRILEVGIMIEFKPDSGVETKVDQIQEFFMPEEVLDPKYDAALGKGTVVYSKRKIVTSADAVIPSISSYLFYSGKGRKYGAWIDTDTAGSSARTNGINKGALIESPIYIIEDLLRTECGLITSGTTTSSVSNDLVDSGAAFTTAMVGQSSYNFTDGTSAFITARESATVLSVGADVYASAEDYYICGLTDDEIDTTTFDTAGNTASNAGNVYNALNGVATTSEWAFSQMKFTNVRDLIVRISRQCGAYVFISGTGKFKIRTLQQSGYSADKVVNYNEIVLNDISLTPLNNVRNNFVVNYHKDYAKDQYQATATASDATSQGTTATGFSQELELEIDADVVSSTTASQIAAMYNVFFKIRHPIISFDCVVPKYNDLEISDIISFSNWDSKIKIYGTALSTSDFYMITNISKKADSCSIKAVKVS